MKQMNIGIFGFGCVGQGLFYALQHSAGFTATIKKIAVTAGQAVEKGQVLIELE